MAARAYKLAARAIHRGNGRPKLREIFEHTDSMPPQVVVVVADADAMDVRQALERAHRDGREDRAGEIRALRDYLTAEIAKDTETGRAWYGTDAGDEAAPRADTNRATLAKMDELEAGQ